MSQDRVAAAVFLRFLTDWKEESGAVIDFGPTSAHSEFLITREPVVRPLNLVTTPTKLEDPSTWWPGTLGTLRPLTLALSTAASPGLLQCVPDEPHLYPGHVTSSSRKTTIQTHTRTQTYWWSRKPRNRNLEPFCCEAPHSKTIVPKPLTTAQTVKQEEIKKKLLTWYSKDSVQ